MIPYKERAEIYDDAAALWGIHAQELMAIEEMSELTKALCKLFRGKPDFDNIAEEIADVQIMIEQLARIFNCGEAVDKAIDYKLERLRKTLQKQMEGAYCP